MSSKEGEISVGHEGSSIEGLLRDAERFGIDYVCWKNNHELEAHLAGQGDLDLFVRPDQRQKFLALSRQAGWVELVNPVARYPHVHHLYRVDCWGEIYHLHIYCRVVTGESWLKEYLLPLEGFLLENRTRSAVENIWVLTDEAQAYLFALRHLLKGGSVSSRALYRRELQSYQREWRSCTLDGQVHANFGPITLSRYTEGARLGDDQIGLPSVASAIGLRASLAPFLRVPWWSLSARRCFSFFIRAVNKTFLRRNKVFEGPGLVVALSGVDGAGKSTMLGALEKFYAGFLTVERYQLGRPQGWFLEKGRWLVFGDRRRGRGRNHHGAKAEEGTKAFKAVSAAIVALVRLRMAKKAIRRAQKGHLVLVDRWPTNGKGQMDGPKITVGDNRQHGLVKRLARFEEWAYSRIPRADVCIFLTVDVDNALVRNRERVKDEKESDVDIRNRFDNNESASPLANKVVYFKNDGEFSEMRGKLIRRVWDEVARH